MHCEVMEMTSPCQSLVSQAEREHCVSVMVDGCLLTADCSLEPVVSEYFLMVKL